VCLNGRRELSQILISLVLLGPRLRLREFEDAQVAIRVSVDELGLMSAREVDRTERQQLAGVFRHTMHHGDDLLILEVEALNGVVVHRHQQQTLLLSNLQNVCVVYRVCQQLLVCQAVHKELIVQSHEDVFLVALARQQIVVVVKQNVCDFDGCILFLKGRLHLHDDIVRSA